MLGLPFQQPSPETFSVSPLITIINTILGARAVAQQVKPSPTAPVSHMGSHMKPMKKIGKKKSSFSTICTNTNKHYEKRPNNVNCLGNTNYYHNKIPQHIFRMAVIKKTDIPNVSKVINKPDSFYIARRNVKWYSYFLSYSYELAILLLVINPKK